MCKPNPTGNRAISTGTKGKVATKLQLKPNLLHISISKDTLKEHLTGVAGTEQMNASVCALLGEGNFHKCGLPPIVHPQRETDI